MKYVMLLTMDETEPKRIGSKTENFKMFETETGT